MYDPTTPPVYGNNLKSSKPSQTGLLCSAVVKHIRNPLVLCKMFYFCFFASFGCLFPLVGIYFKQLGLSAAQTGTLIGLRPIFEFICTPIWSKISERYDCKKFLLIMSLISWLAFTISISAVQPPPSYCLSYNGSAVIIIPAFMNKDFVVKGVEDVKKIHKNAFSTTAISTKYPNSSFTYKINTAQSVPINIIGKDFGNNNASTVNNKTYLNNTTPQPTNKTTIIPTTNVTTTAIRILANSSTFSSTLLTQPLKITTLPSNKTTNKTLHKKQYIIYTYDKYKLVNETHINMQRVGISPIRLSIYTVANLEEMAESNNSGLITPSFSSIVYRYSNVSSSFLLLLIIMIVAEIFSSPSILLSDMATLELFNYDITIYSKQRIFGSIGWAAAMFIGGVALEKSQYFNNHPCGESQVGEHNYTVSFILFSIMMVLTIIISTQLKFPSDSNWLSNLFEKLTNYINTKPLNTQNRNNESYATENRKSHGENKENAQSAYQDGHIVANEYEIFDCDESDYKTNENNNTQHYQNQPKNNDTFTYHAFSTGDITLMQLVHVMKLYGTNVVSVVYMIMIWYTGVGFGMIFTFLFWHLQDIRGNTILFGIISVINHISEVVAVRFIHYFTKLGQQKTLALGLCINFIRFIFISLITNPWWVLLVEGFQGITHVAVWISCCSYLLKAFNRQQKPTAQFILHTLYNGVGRGCGGVFGGLLISYYGSIYVFRVYATGCLILGILLTGGIFFLKSFFIKFEMLFDENDNKEETIHFAPVGVPINPLSMGQRCRSDEDIKDTTYKSIDVHDQDTETNKYSALLDLM
ncbi:hypothetical protein A3Q56_02157 [Intoshia linei]|uniref:Major facilitator superfamily associated domain-containing protein n=1 Tax=Intoshia linei TaxID=1819745 RepID=A0A177B727_9BILA|nr:hypothetical protein A3Q56_02157 [Intoshia linei]